MLHEACLDHFLMSVALRQPSVGAQVYRYTDIPVYLFRSTRMYCISYYKSYIYTIELPCTYSVGLWLHATCQVGDAQLEADRVTCATALRACERGRGDFHVS